MQLLKQNDKLITAINGNIYKQPLLIDISYQYGVTKNGSNQVSAVKNKNNPNRFMQLNVANQPIENGNGFEFNGSNVLFGEISELPVQNQSFCFEFWIKVNSVSTLGSTFFQVGTEAGEFYVRYGITETLQVAVGGNVINNVMTFTMGQWYHVFIDYRKTIGIGINKARGIYVNGNLKNRSVADTELNFNIIKSKFSLGNYGRIYSADRVLNGAIAVFKYQKKSIIDSEQFTQNQQVFIPPTYPNTIL